MSGRGGKTVQKKRVSEILIFPLFESNGPIFWSFPKVRFLAGSLHGFIAYALLLAATFKGSRPQLFCIGAPPSPLFSGGSFAHLRNTAFIQYAAVNWYWIRQWKVGKIGHVGLLDVKILNVLVPSISCIVVHSDEQGNRPLLVFRPNYYFFACKNSIARDFYCESWLTGLCCPRRFWKLTIYVCALAKSHPHWKGRGGGWGFGQT